MKIKGLAKKFSVFALALSMGVLFTPAIKNVSAAGAEEMYAVPGSAFGERPIFLSDPSTDKTSGDYTYHEDGNGNVIITGYKGSAKKVTIPSSIDGKKVVSLAGAFKNNTTVTDVVLPSSVTRIEKDTFYCADSLVNINLENVKIIDEKAFYDCDSLGNIIIPSGMQSLDGESFTASHIKKLVINNSAYAERGMDCTIDELVIGGKPKVISNSAYYCSHIKTITIPDSVTEIEDGAFYLCDYSSIKLPNNLTSIGSEAFFDNVNLKSVTIPKSVTKIGDYALGYYYDYDHYTYGIIKGFTIIGYKGTAAETYAKDNGIKFVEVKEGFVPEKGAIYYYKNNVLQSNLTEVIKDTKSGKWYNVVKGKVTAGPTISKNSNGWFYIDKNGVVDFGYTGLAQNSNGWFYCKNGKVDFSYNGVVKNDYGWWAVQKGKVNFGYTGFAQNSNGWWYCKNGKVDFGKKDVISGTVNGQSGWWFVSGGQVKFIDSVEKNAYGWWCIQKGKVNFSFTGLAKNSSGWWYCKNGKVQFGYTGKVVYNGKTYNVKDGKMQ